MPFIKTTMPHAISYSYIDLFQRENEESYKSVLKELDEQFFELISDLPFIHPSTTSDHTEALYSYINDNFDISNAGSIEEAQFMIYKIFGSEDNFRMNFINYPSQYVLAYIVIHAMAMIYAVLMQMMTVHMVRFLTKEGMPLSPNFLALRDLPVELMDQYIDYVEKTFDVADKLGYIMPFNRLYSNSFGGLRPLQEAMILHRMLFS